MNNPLDPSLRELDACGCCAGTGRETPAPIDNRPGLAAIAFRAGSHAQFRASLKAALASRLRPALAGLRTRENDDFSIALLDSVATVADVLTFYSERIANEAYLRTATERRSVLELARAIGYELHPGVAADTLLAFTIEPAAGAPGYAKIDTGTQVQSLPGPGERPQTFETIEPLDDARKEWNRIAAKATRRQTPYWGMTQLDLQGAATNLKPGDALLVVGDERLGKRGDERWDFRRVRTVQVVPHAEPDRTRTVVVLDQPLGSVTPHVEPAKQNAKVYALRQRASVFGHNAPDWKAMPPELREKYGETVRNPLSEWPGFAGYFLDLKEGKYSLHLDAVYSGAVPFGWAVVARPGYSELFRVLETVEDSQTNFTLSGKCTQLTVEGENLAEEFAGLRRQVSVFLQSEELPWAESPVLEPVRGRTIELDAEVPAPPSGRRLLVQGRRSQVRIAAADGELEWQDGDGSSRKLKRGESFTIWAYAQDPAQPTHASLWTLRDGEGREGIVRAQPDQFEFRAADADGPWVVEAAAFRQVSASAEGRTVFELQGPLRGAYDPATVTIWANVAPATHGQTVRDEVLGSGDASRAHQRFALKQGPLTFTPAATTSGGDSTLEIWVNDVRWQEVPTLYGRGPDERVYVTRRADDGVVTVLFGDGRHGARLPTGRENVRAVYRQGIGRDGLVKADQLSLLMTRPLGVKSVTNPQPSSGAQDPQTLDAARENAPLTVLTLDRLVSLRDYEDFARAFSGVAKAHAVWTWSPRARSVFVTVAGPDGQAIPADSTTRANLIQALGEYGNPLVRIEVQSCRDVKFRLSGTVRVASDRLPEKVGEDVRTALRDAFSFAARQFGQSVSASEVIAAVQQVPGVDSLDLDTLYRADQTAALRSYLPSARPVDGGGAAAVEPAELLTLDETCLSSLVFLVSLPSPEPTAA